MAIATPQGSGGSSLGSDIATAEIQDAAVTLAKMADLAQNRTIGRITSGTGVPEALTPEQQLTVAGFPSAFMIGGDQRVWQPRLQAGGNFLMIAQTAYFLYLGITPRAMTPKYVAALLQTVSTTDSVGEVGFFTTPLPGGSKADQTLTPVASAFKTAWDDLTATGGAAPRRVGNAVALAISIPASVHLWVGARTNTGGNEPTFTGAVHDAGRGFILTLAGAAAFDGSTTYAGVRPAVAASAAVAPWLWAEMD